jgi:hypothetical protein
MVEGNGTGEYTRDDAGPKENVPSGSQTPRGGCASRPRRYRLQGGRRPQLDSMIRGENEVNSIGPKPSEKIGAPCPQEGFSCYHRPRLGQRLKETLG